MTADTEAAAAAANAVDPTTPSAASAVRAYQSARDHVARVEDQLRDAKEVLAKAQQRVLDLYAEDGVQSMRLDGRLVYLIRQLRVRATRGEENELVDALVSEGHDELARRRVLPQTLTAWWRECEREEVEIPESIQAHVQVAELFTLGMMKG